MNLKIILSIVAGLVVFLVLWIFNMISGVALLIGFGFGILLHDYITNMFKDWQKRIYLTEKISMQHKITELQAEVNRLKKEAE